MRLFRQLGSCGTALVLGPLLWAGLCVGFQALGQHAYASNITPWTRTFHVPDGPELDVNLSVARRVDDPRVKTELEKYLKVWSLEPGACAAFPNAERMPFSWNPFHASALMMRLKQKQAFLLMQHHVVRRRADGALTRYYLAPDPEAALGGRRFVLRAEGQELREAFEL
jgi:hypothetical protein